MKKLLSVLAAAALCAAMLAGCGSSASSDAASTAPASEAASEAASSEPAADSAGEAPAETANTEFLEAVVASIEEVNPVANPRAIDDDSAQYEMFLTLDNLVASRGDVTNNQSDCALVFAAQAKEGCVDAVLAELQTYKDSLTANDMYAEYADKIAKAQDARIVSKGNYVVMVISGVEGPDYSAIDSAIDAALAG